MQKFIKNEIGAGLVEYAVALVVVTLVGGVIFGLGSNISKIVGASAGSF